MSPAAISQAWRAISTYRSIAPLATWAKFQAAEPAERTLEKLVSQSFINNCKKYLVGKNLEFTHGH